MKSLDFGRYVLGGFAAAAMLTGCGGPQPPIGAPGTMPQSRAIATHAKRGGSWMLPEAKRGDLLYVSDFNRKYIEIYTYPALKSVGKLAVPLRGVDGLCSDASGNVWVITQDDGIGTLTEYAHGGDTPIATLPIPGMFPLGCTVDRSTGALAVAHDAIDVSIYQNEQGTPQTYTDSGIAGIYSLTYDTNGDLFIYGSKAIGASRYPLLGELPSGGSSFSNRTFHQKVLLKTFAQWNGQDILLSGITAAKGETETETLWTVAVSKSKLKVISEKTFDGVQKHGIGQFGLLRGNTLLQQDRSGNLIYVFSYSAGGASMKTIKNFPGSQITKMTISD